MPRNSKPKAITLLEIIISIAIFILIGTAITMVFNRSLIVYRASTDKSEAAMQAQSAIEWLSRDIGSAYNIIVAQSGSIAVVTPNASGVDYVYYFLTEDGELKRQICGSTEYLVAEGVSRFSLEYYDINNQVVANPAENLLSVRVVEIDIDITEGKHHFHLNTVAGFEYNPDHSWAKAYGGASSDYFEFIQQTSDGGYVLSGQASSFAAGTNKPFVVKTFANGELDWARTYSIANLTSLFSFQEDSNGDYFSGGKNSYGFVLIKADSTGDIGPAGTWARTYSLSMPSLSFVRESGGGYIFGGSAAISGNFDGVVIQTDDSGNVQWAKNYGGSGNDYLNCIQEAAGGAFLLGGSDSSFGPGTTDFLLIEIDSAGNENWTKIYGGGSGFSNLEYIQTVSAGGYLLVGRTTSFGVASTDGLVIKIDGLGNVEWAKTYGAGSWDGLFFAQETADGGFILGGDSNSFSASSGAYDTLLIKTDSVGNLEWAKTYSGAVGADYHYLKFIVVTEDNGYAIVGKTDYFGVGEIDGLLIKLNSSGDMNCCSLISDITTDLTVVSRAVTGDDSHTIIPGIQSITPGTPGVSVMTPVPTVTFICPAPSSL